MLPTNFFSKSGIGFPFCIEDISGEIEDKEKCLTIQEKDMPG